jgi:hypothetical protein
LREDGPLGPDVELSLFVVITPLLRPFCLVASLTGRFSTHSLCIQAHCARPLQVTRYLLLSLLLLRPLYHPPHQISRFS